MSPTIRFPFDRQLRLAALPTAPGLARAFVRHTLRQWSVPRDCSDDVELLASELVTNAVRRTGRADGPSLPYPTETVVIVGVRIMRHGHVIRLEVWDRDPTPPQQPTEPSDEDDSGRGLLLVAALSQMWGARLSRAGGKVVWCEVARDMTAPMKPHVSESPPKDRTRTTEQNSEPRPADVALLERVMWRLRRLNIER